MVYPIIRHTIFPLVRFFIKKIVGLENVPRQGPFIIACKHMASLDGVFIAAAIIPALKRKIHFVTNIAHWGWFWEKVVAEKISGCIPFYKDNPKICLDIAIHYLQQGEIIGIFPEGLLQDYDPKKFRAKTGAARMAIRGQVPVVPVGLVHDVSTRSDLTKLYRRREAVKHSLLNPHSMEIHIGEPFELTEFYGREWNKEMLTEATNKIMEHIDVLTKINIKHNN